MADGIKLGDLEIQADFATSGIRFTFAQGGLQSLANFRGEDDIVPEASGRYPGQFIADGRDVVLHGFISGSGSDAQAIRESFAAAFASVLARMQPTDLIALTVYPPNFGLAMGDAATLQNVRPLRIVAPEPTRQWYEAWEGNLELVCIDSPPEWVVAPTGS